MSPEINLFKPAWIQLTNRMDSSDIEAANEKKAALPPFGISGLVLSLSGLMEKSRPAAKVSEAKASGSLRNSRLDKSVFELIKLDAKQHEQALRTLALIAAAASVFLFFNYLKAGIVLISLTALGAISRAWQRFFPVEFGVELVMLATVISGFAYGAFAGLFVGVVSLILSTILTQEDPGKMWPAFATIGFIGFLAGTLTIANVALWGVIFTVAYDAIITAIYISMGFSIIKTLIFDATHIAFNYFVFYHVAPILISGIL